jgi:serine/threonine protein kinase
MTINSGHDARDDGGPETFDGSGPRLHTGELEALLDDVLPRPPVAQRPRGAEDPYVGLLVDRRYEIEALIAAGGMGLVYRCRHSVLGKKLAIKIIRGDVAHMPGGLQRFLLEAKAASSVGNEHIVDISDFGALPDGSPYIVMELLDGVPLSALAQQKSRLSLARIIGVARQIAEGLGAAHAIGIVHRDLKPDNLLVLERKGEDFVKILDFGVARMVESAKKLTQVGTIIGTPHYMSPEQASGEEVDARGDIYSLGVILYELCAGRVPFDGEHYLAVLHQHRSVPPPPLASLDPPVVVPRTFEHVIRRCLEKSRDSRYASMAELSADLGFVLASQSFAAAAARSLAPLPSEGHPRESGRGLASSHASPVPGTIANASPPEPSEAESFEAESPEAAAPERGSAARAGDDAPPETVRYAEPRPDVARSRPPARARRGSELPTLVQAPSLAPQAAPEPAVSRQASAAAPAASGQASGTGSAPGEATLVLPHANERPSPAYRRWAPALALAAALASGVWAVSSIRSDSEMQDSAAASVAPAAPIRTSVARETSASPATATATAGDAPSAPSNATPEPRVDPSVASAPALPVSPQQASSVATTSPAPSPPAAVTKVEASPADAMEPVEAVSAPDRTALQARPPSKKAARKRKAALPAERASRAEPAPSAPSPSQPAPPEAPREGFMNPWPAPR